MNVQVSVIDLETTRTLFAQVKIRQFLDQPLCKISRSDLSVIINVPSLDALYIVLQYNVFNGFLLVSHI